MLSGELRRETSLDVMVTEKPPAGQAGLPSESQTAAGQEEEGLHGPTTKGPLGGSSNFQPLTRTSYQ